MAGVLPSANFRHVAPLMLDTFFSPQNGMRYSMNLATNAGSAVIGARSIT